MDLPHLSFLKLTLFPVFAANQIMGQATRGANGPHQNRILAEREGKWDALFRALDVEADEEDDEDAEEEDDDDE
jgi:hypothetical protein